MSRRIFHLGGLILIITFLVVACTGGEIPTPTAPPVTDTTIPPTEEATNTPVPPTNTPMPPTDTPPPPTEEEPTEPTEEPTGQVEEEPTGEPTETPTEEPTEVAQIPTETPTEEPTEVAQVPTEAPTEVVVEQPAETPTEMVVEQPTMELTEVVVEQPTEEPTEAVVEQPTVEPTEVVGGGAPVIDFAPTGDGYSFLIESTLDTLVADGESETTLYAFLFSEDGSGIDGERVRFVLKSGRAFLLSPQDVRELTQNVQPNVSMTASRSRQVAVDGVNIGNGVYIARLVSSEVAGPVTISAEWLTSPMLEVPQVTSELELVTAESLVAHVDDTVILADGEDSATVIAYVLDGLNRPVANANVTFRILDGPGRLTAIPNRAQDRNVEIIRGQSGRYSAIYGSSRTPGEVIIEVALPTITNPIRSTISIQVVEATTLDAVAFPERVSRRISNNLRAENIATILVAVRDGDGDIVSGLDQIAPNTGRIPLKATIISGPGQVVGPVEILQNNRGTGVYQFTFVPSDTTGETIIEITNLNSPSLASTQARVNTVTDVNRGVISQAQMFSVGDEPLYADGQSQALVIAMAADRDGNVANLTNLTDPRFLLIEGQGSITDRGKQLESAIGFVDSGRVFALIGRDKVVDANDPERDEPIRNTASFPTGIWVDTFTVSNRNADTTSIVRSVFTTSSGNVVTEETGVIVTALASPEVVIFPNPVPSGRNVEAVIDIFDINDQMLDFMGEGRYRVEIESGPGDVAGDSIVSTNSGTDGDIQADDNVSTVLFELSIADNDVAANQDVRLVVVDQAISGFPRTETTLQIGEETQLKAQAAPFPADPGDTVQIIAFAQDEFGLPATGHELVLTVISGSASVIDGGRMTDEGPDDINPPGGFRDAIANDGAYTGAVRITGVAEGSIRIRITDLTPPTQPITELVIPITRR